MKTFIVLAALVAFAFADDGYDKSRQGYGKPYGGGYRRHGGYGYGYGYYQRCPKLIGPAFGSVEVSGRKPGSIATYSCNEGYSLSGDDTRKCQKYGEWSGEAPTCEICDCGAPDPADPNGSLAVGSTTFWSTAVYSCNMGYLLDTSGDGSQVVVCQADKTWSDTAPGCKPVDCGYLIHPKNGDVEFVPDTTLRSEARFTCRRGYELVGTDTRVCQKDGEWSLTSPTCEKIQCPKLNAPKYGKVVVSGQCVDDYAVYRCAYGYKLSGKRRRVCQEDGTWSEPEPECTKRDYYGYGYPKHGY